jgi:pantetheine-phosphate adenylyltransferase
MQKKIGVYPGSFDPLHSGHFDLILRCRELFDEVVVAILRNTAKTDSMFTVEERVEMLGEVLAPYPDVRVESFSGLLVDFLAGQNARTIVRGLRAVSDFDYELQMTGMNRHLAPRVETIFLTPKEEYSYLSSRLIKEVYRLGGDCRGLVPDAILARLPPRS